MSIEIREMVAEDYDKVISLWSDSEGVGLSNDDNYDGISKHLYFNPGLSFVAFDRAELVGAVICGQDGRRGYLNHLAVNKAYQRRGIGEALVNSCLGALRGRGITKCHIFVFKDNPNAIAFWDHTGWLSRDELIVMSKSLN